MLLKTPFERCLDVKINLGFQLIFEWGFGIFYLAQPTQVTKLESEIQFRIEFEFMFGTEAEAL